MLCFLQLALAVCGVLVMRKPTLRVGKQYAYPPFPFLIGLVLVSQFAICLLYGFKVGYEEAQKAAKEGRKDVDIVSLQSRHIWADLAIPVASLCMVGVLLQIGLREKMPEDDGQPEWKKKLLERMRMEAEMDPLEFVREEPLDLPTLPEPEDAPTRGRRPRPRKEAEQAEDAAIDLKLYTDATTPPPRELRRRRWRFRKEK